MEDVVTRTHGYEESLGDGRPLALQGRDELREVDHLVDQLPLLHVQLPSVYDVGKIEAVLK